MELNGNVESYFTSIYIKQVMATHEQIFNPTPESGVTSSLQHIENAFIIPLPCVLCDNNIAVVREVYNLLDFDNHGGIDARTVQFWYAYQYGYKVTIVVLELKTGQMLKRSHRLNNDTLPCDWVLIDFDFLNRMPKIIEQTLNDFLDQQK